MANRIFDKKNVILLEVNEDDLNKTKRNGNNKKKWILEELV